jgi:hypothetical protein
VSVFVMRSNTYHALNTMRYAHVLAVTELLNKHWRQNHE